MKKNLSLKQTLHGLHIQVKGPFTPSESVTESDNACSITLRSRFRSMYALRKLNSANFSKMLLESKDVEEI